MGQRSPTTPLVYALGFLTTLLAALGAAGWVLSLPVLRSLLEGGSTMKPNTAVGLFGLGAALMALARGRRPLVARLLAAPAMGLGLLTLVQYLFQVDLGIDTLFWRPESGSARFSMATATGLSLLGVGVLASTFGRRGAPVAQALGLGVANLSLIALIVYTYNPPALRGVSFFSTMALHTALALFAASWGLIFSQPEGFVARLLVGPGPGRALARWLIPISTLTPWLMGLAIQSVTSRAQLDVSYAFALLATGCAVISGVLVAVGTLLVSRRERDFETTLDSIGDAVLVTDQAGLVVRLNPKAEALTGWPSAEAVGAHVSKVFTVVDEGTRAPLDSPVDKVLRDGQVVELSNHTLLVARDGRTTPIADCGAPVRGADGSVRGVVMVFRDVSEQSQARASLERSTRELVGLMNAMPVGIVVQTAEGKPLYANPTALESLGFPSLEALGSGGFYSRVHPSELEVATRRGNAWSETGLPPPPRRVRMLKADGSEGTYESRPVGTVIFGQQPARLSLLDQVDRRDEAMRRLDEANARVAVLSELSRDLAEANLELPEVLERATRACMRLIGDAAMVRLRADDPDYLDPPASISMRDEKFRPVIDRIWRSNRVKLAENVLAPVIFQGQVMLAGREELVRSLPKPVLEAMGDEVPSGVVVAPLRAAGQVVGILAVGRFGNTPSFSPDEVHFVRELADRAGQAIANAQLYTRIKEALAEKAKAQSALQDTEAQLRQSQKLEAVGRLAGGVAHDFNNLLTVILSLSELLLRKHPGDESDQASLQEIRAAGERAAELTRQLLAFSRKQVVQPKVLVLNAVVLELESMLRRLIGENIELVLDLAPASPLVKADPGLLGQVVINLAVNARDAMPSGGRLTLRTTNPTEPDAMVSLTVSDTGTGMGPDVLERLFEPFFTTKATGAGTGLGLSTSYGIVQQSGGHIRVTSEPGKGSSFEVQLPKATGNDGQPALVPTPSPPRARTGITILLVEDEPVVRKVGKAILERAGHTVLVAARAEEALELFAKHGDDVTLLVTDVVMPGISGRELANQLVQRKSALKVILCSGYTEDAVVHHGVFDGELAFVQKPFTPDSLTRKVNDVLAAPGGAPMRR